MSNLVDLWSEREASLIGDDTLPTLTLKNTSTGPGLKVDTLVVMSGASINLANLSNLIIPSGATINSAVTAENALVIGRTVISSPTVALLKFFASGASVPIMSFGGAALVSCTTIKFTTGGVAGTYALRIKNPDDTLSWIPCLPDAAVTAAAI